MTLPSLCVDMLALVALLIIFLGLVGLLAVIGEWQKRRRRRRGQHSSPVPDSNGGSESLEQVKRWLARHQHCLPTPQQVLDLLSESLHKFSSQVSCGWLCGMPHATVSTACFNRSGER